MKNDFALKRFWSQVLIAVCWLLILLVPSLRSVFRVQLGGSPLISFSALPAQKNIPNFWEKSARRFPDDALVLWQAADEYPVTEGSNESDDAAIAASSAGNAATSLPEPALPTSQVFPGQLKGDRNAEKLRRLDLLIARFPDNTDFIAARLRTMFAWMGNGRVGGELSDGNIAENRAAGKPSPERSAEEPNYTKADLQKVILLARRGQKLEPDNGFFDWMECCFSMLAWRDEQAFGALEVAAKKPRFDDHSLQEQQAANAALEKVFGRPLVMEEKTQNLAAAVYPSFSRYREMARILSWQAIKAQRRGDDRQALRIIAAQARVGARMRENANSSVEGLAAVAIIGAIAWGSANYDARKSARSGAQRQTTPALWMSSFQAYAAKHGRPELAAEAQRSSAAGAKFRAVIAANANGGANGTPFGVFSRVGRVKGVLRLPQTSAGETPSAREVWNGALACGGLRALATAMSGAVVVGLCIASIMIGAGESAQVFKAIGDFWSELSNAIGDVVGIYEIQYLLIASENLSSQWRVVLALSPLLFGVLFAAWRATEWQKARNGERPFVLQAFIRSLFQGRAFSSPTAAHDDFDIAAVFLKILDWFLMLLLIGSWMTLAAMDDPSSSTLWLIPAALVLFFGGILLAEKIAAWHKRPARFAALRFGLRLLKRSLWTWLVLGSALYLVLLLVSLPLRRQAEARVEGVLRLGEIRAAKSN